MGRIKVLGDELVSLISAGEVIENPSSVVKELIENSLDAGATHIEVDILRGGIDRIVVSDNGTGILKEDCPICLLRYSTSKIDKKEDIDEITTYGFRGEALASIAAVANLKIITRAVGQELGTTLVSRIGEGTKMNDASRPTGTKVEVSDLFKEVPARRKHLSTPQKEAQRILDIVMRHAVIRYDVGFHLVRDGVTQIDCPSNQTARERIVHLWGREIAKKLVDLNYSADDIEFRGFVVRAPVSRGNRSREYFSVLNRPIENTRLSLAAERAYSTLLMKGRYPMFAIDIVVKANHVDANVHPTKREVRILEIERMANILAVAVREVLQTGPLQETPPRLQEYMEAKPLQSAERESEPVSLASFSSEPMETLAEQLDFSHLSTSIDEEGTEILGGVFRIIGQIHNLYILLEVEDGLLIVDQHAAHERVLYEWLRRQANEGSIASQELLEPIVLSLDAGDAERIMELAESLENVGYSISSFGGNEVLVSSVPEILGHRANEDELVALVDRMVDIGINEASTSFMDEAVKITACHSAIRAGKALNAEEIRDLLSVLYETKSRHHCCHGRPTMLKIPKMGIDKAVGRLGPEAIERYRARHRINK